MGYLNGYYNKPYTHQNTHYLHGNLLSVGDTLICNNISWVIIAICSDRVRIDSEHQAEFTPKELELFGFIYGG